MAHYFTEYLKDLRAIAAAIKKHPRAQVLAFSIGKAATESVIARAQPTVNDEGELTHSSADDAGILPEELLKIARIADGARLRWSLDAEGGELVEGQIHLPSLEWLQYNTNRSFNDGDLGFSLAPSTQYSDLVLPSGIESDTVYAFDRQNVQVRAENLTVAAVRWAELRRLGIRGWELVFQEHEVEDEADLAPILAECERQAMVAYRELGLRTPADLGSGLK